MISDQVVTVLGQQLQGMEECNFKINDHVRPKLFLSVMGDVLMFNFLKELL